MDKKKLFELAGVPMDSPKVKALLEDKLPKTKTRYYTKPNEYVVTIGDQVMKDAGEAIWHKMDADFKKAGLKDGKDYEWGIAGGDDFPHGLVVHNPKVLEVPNFESNMKKIEGKSAY